MNKTSITRKLPCGCVERRWAFGSEIIDVCRRHMFATRRSLGETRHWSGGNRG